MVKVGVNISEAFTTHAEQTWLSCVEFLEFVFLVAWLSPDKGCPNLGWLSSNNAKTWEGRRLCQGFILLFC